MSRRKVTELQSERVKELKGRSVEVEKWRSDWASDRGAWNAAPAGAVVDRPLDCAWDRLESLSYKGGQKKMTR
jgi:hypothetical protein